MSTRWFCYRWNEDRGDEFADWGCSTWLFATDQEGIVERQVEIYDGGAVLVYDALHANDTYGMLTDRPIDPTAPGVESITEEEFEHLTASLKPLNRDG